MRKEGIKVVLPDINRTRFGFRPDAKNNEIIYGLKAISGIGASIANAIVDNQSYTSFQDFYDKMQIYKNRMKEQGEIIEVDNLAEDEDIDEDSNKKKVIFGDTSVIALIKAGCFDELEGKPRKDIMADFIRSISKPIKKLDISHIEDFNKLGLLTPAQQKYELRLYRYRNYVFQKKNLARQGGKSASTAFYKLDHKFAEPYFYEHFESEMTEGKDYEYTEDGYIAVKRGSFDRVFDKLMSDKRGISWYNQ